MNQPKINSTTLCCWASGLPNIASSCLLWLTKKSRDFCEGGPQKVGRCQDAEKTRKPIRWQHHKIPGKNETFRLAKAPPTSPGMAETLV